MLPDAVLAKLDLLPASPGVYVFRDASGTALYIGKAVSLRSRVRSYFQEGSSDSRYFIPRLVHEIGDIETFVAASEREALLLENQLVKQHQPRYNVKLRDDKEYLSLRLDPKGAWPRLEVVRRPRQDQALYFGPYHSATAARKSLRLVNRHFQLRTCTDSDFASRKRPCLQYQIRRCPGPCVFPVDRALYGEHVNTVALFLSGKHEELVRGLSAKMRGSAEATDYEQAAIYRDQIRAVERIHEEQRVAGSKDVDQDAIGFFRQADHAEIAVLEVRSGRVVGVHTFALRDLRLPDEEVLGSFVTEYYARGASIPDEVLLPLEIEAAEGLSEVLTEQRHAQGIEARAHVILPKRGGKAALLKMAFENAEHAFREKQRAKEDVETRLADLQRRLRLPTLPRRIECIDISHTQGDDTVAAIVALLDGAPDRKRYKSFRVRAVRGGDDYGAMYEVLSRRLSRGKNLEKGWELPDLLVVDGGRGQLNVALAAIRDVGIPELAVCGLAKERQEGGETKVVDRVYLPGQKNPIALRESNASLAFLALARDEAHRASNLHRTKLGLRRTIRSALDDVEGIGPKTRAKLLSKLGSMEAVRAASEDALVAAGATRKQAALIRQILGATDGESAAPAAEPPAPPAATPDLEESAVQNAFDHLEPA